MEVITSIFFNVFLTTVTGTSGLLIWFMLLPILRKKGLDMVYFFLKLVLFLYLFPVLPLVQFWKYNDSGEESIYGIVTLSNESLRAAFSIGAVIWIIVGIILILRRLWEYYRLRENRKGDVPVEQEEAEVIFERICRELKLKRHVGLCSNDLCPWPCLTGFRHPTVILPYKKYSAKELEMILYHELIHYKNHELEFKLLTELIKILHWFNLFVYCLLYLYEEWSETYCDMLTCRKGEKYFTKKEYFNMLLEQSDKEENEEKPNLFSSFLFGDGLLERRTKRVMKYKNKKQMSRLVVSLLMAVFMVGSSVPAFAVGGQMLMAYEEVYLETAGRNEENKYGKVLTEHVIEDVDWSQLEDSVEIGEWENPDARAVRQINWEVAVGRLKRTYGFEATAGGEIAILIGVDPPGDTIEIGIIDPDGDMRYILGDGETYFNHYFTLTKTGTYYFYVRNLSNNDITVTGTVGY